MSQSNKQKLIQDIQQLLNAHKGGSITQINPALLEYMSEEELKTIIDDLLKQKEKFLQTEMEWLQSFKKSSEY